MSYSPSTFILIISAWNAFLDNIENVYINSKIHLKGNFYVYFISQGDIFASLFVRVQFFIMTSITLVLIHLPPSLECELFSVIHCRCDDLPIEFLHCCLHSVSSIVVFVDLNLNLKFNDLSQFLGPLPFTPTVTITTVMDTAINSPT